MVIAALSGVLLHVAVGRGEPSAVAGALGVLALAMALRGARPSRGLLVGMTCGLATWLPSVRFVVFGAENAGSEGIAPFAIALAVAAVHALRLAVAGWLATRLAARVLPVGVATALALFAAETFDPAPMPWSLGAATIDRPWLSAAADLGGPALAGLVLATTGGLLFDVLDPIVRWDPPTTAQKRTLVAFSSLLLALVVRGAVATRFIEEAIAAAPRERVAAIATRWVGDTERLAAPHLRKLAEAAAREADVVVLPEAMLTSRSAEMASATIVGAFGDLKADLVVGAAWTEATGDVNVLAHLPAGAQDVAWYVKARAFPVGEANPTLTSILGLERSPGTLGPGDLTARSAFEVRGRHVAPAICWEDLFAEAGRESARAGGPSWIVVSLNDGWFVRYAARNGHDVGDQHLLHARIRAVEARRAVVRSANLGTSAIVDPLGGVTRPAPRAPLVSASIPLLDVETVAVRTRGGVSWALAALVVAAALLGLRSPGTSAAS